MKMFELPKPPYGPPPDGQPPYGPPPDGQPPPNHLKAPKEPKQPPYLPQKPTDKF